MAYFRGRFVAN